MINFGYEIPYKELQSTTFNFHLIGLDNYNFDPKNMLK